MRTGIDYLILTLPRSGSAWLANFLSHGPSLCLHEPLADVRDLRDLQRPAGWAGLLGVIDSGAWMQMDRLPAVGRIFALERSHREVARSLRRLELAPDVDFEAFDRVTAGLPKFQYESLFDVEYLEQLWMMVVGAEHPFDAARAKQLVGMRVTVDLSQLAKRVSSTYLGD